MAQSINAFKNRNETTSAYSDDTCITNLKFVNGKITARCTGLTTAKKIKNFDHGFKILGLAFNTSYGLANHAFNVYNGASAAANLLATVRPVASNVKYQAALLDPTKATVAAGGFLTITVSGASWKAASGAAPRGYLEIDTVPV